MKFAQNEVSRPPRRKIGTFSYEAEDCCGCFGRSSAVGNDQPLALCLRIGANARGFGALHQCAPVSRADRGCAGFLHLAHLYVTPPD